MKRFLGLSFIMLLAFVFVGCNKKPIEVELKLTDDEKAIQLVIGEEKEIKPVVTKGFELVWSSDKDEIARVVNGKITALAVGTAKITVQVKDRDEKEIITVTVVQPNPTEVVISGDGNVVIGESIQLEAEVKPAPADQTLTWSSEDDKIATVDDTGKVTGVKAGEVKIIAKSVIDTVMAEVTITVVVPDPTGITISGIKEVYLGKKATYKATVTPNLANQEVLWSVNDNDIAEIAQDGTLTAKAVGTVKVIATSKVTDLKQEFEVKIIPIVPLAVTLTGPTNIYISKTANYTATVNPSDANQSITWSVNDTSKATIDQDGKLTAIEKGVVRVRATSILENVYAEIEVTLEEFVPTEIIISGKKIAIIGGTAEYTAVVLPEGINQEVTWSVSDENIASISADGVLTPIIEGEVTIIATSVELTTVTAEYKVSVREATKALLLEALADGMIAQYPGQDVYTFLDHYGFSGYTLTHSNNKMLFYGYNSYIPLRAMAEGETVLPWQVVQPHTTEDAPNSNYGLRLDGPVPAGPADGFFGTGAIYHNNNATDVVVKYKELYGYQNDSAWGHTTYGVILVDSDGLIKQNYSSNDLAIGIDITIPAGHYLLTIFQGDRGALTGSGAGDGGHSFAGDANFAVGKTVKIEFHEELVFGKE